MIIIFIIPPFVFPVSTPAGYGIVVLIIMKNDLLSLPCVFPLSAPVGYDIVGFIIVNQ